MRKIAILLTSLALCGPAPLFAQSAAQPSAATTEGRMLELAQILGTLHYVRVLCAPADGQFWRDRMMEMIRLEKPSLEQKNRLINEFNAGYQDGSTRFVSCTAQARSFAATTARRGETLAQSLSDAIGVSG